MVKRTEDIDEIQPDDALEVDTVEPEVEPVKVEAPKITLTPEQIASRQMAHDIKVAKFLSGGEF